MAKQTTRQLAKAIEKLKDLQLQQQGIKEKFLNTNNNPAKKEIYKKQLIDMHKKVQAAQKEFDILLASEPDPDIEDTMEESVSIKKLREIIRARIKQIVESETSDKNTKYSTFLITEKQLSELIEKITTKIKRNSPNGLALSNSISDMIKFYLKKNCLTKN